MATKQPLEVALNDDPGDDSRYFAGGFGASWPNHPVKGRFKIIGLVVGGMKSLLYRRVEILMTVGEAIELRDSLTRWINDYPDTGKDVQVHTGGSHL